MNIALLIYTIIFIAILYLTCSKYEYFPNVLIKYCTIFYLRFQLNLKFLMRIKYLK